MHDLIRRATVDIAEYLSEHLPSLSPQWWQQHVLNRLSFQQQRMVQERKLDSLHKLDLAALLRIFDQNWYELSNQVDLPREARSWLKELQTVRNRWAHISSEAIPPSDIYRDADTLGRMLGMIGAPEATIAEVEVMKRKAASAIAGVQPVLDAPPAQEPQSPPASGEASWEATGPLFKVGDLVALRSQTQVLLPVIEVIAGGVEFRYRVFQNNSFAAYYESQLQAVGTLADERRSVGLRELHAHLTGLQVLSPSTSSLFSLRSGRVQFVPYQYRPVLKLIRADRPRLLIADEVGVGKTIEAGLIIKELRSRLDISSILVICPKALVAERKWHSEMKRFDEHFTALDGPLLRHCLRETHLEGEWPEQYGKAILPFSLLDSDLVFGRTGRGRSDDRGLLKLDPPPRFDLVIVDEAHHIRNPETYLHQGVRYFCDNAQAVVLMTATPVQLGSNDLFTLLNVLRPDLIIDRPSFEHMAAPNRFINSAVQHCRSAAPDWQAQALADLDQIASTEWGRLFLREDPSFQSIYDRLQTPDLGNRERVGLIREIEELYTFSSMINRTRRRDIGEFATRKPETVSVEFTPAQCALHDSLLEVVARILARCHGDQNVKFMMTTVRRQAASCLYGLAPLLADMLGGKLDALELLEASDHEVDADDKALEAVRDEITSILNQARALDPYDPKLASFLTVLEDKQTRPNNKALVFSTFRHTLAYLDRHTLATGLRMGLVHGGVPEEERAELRRRFALPRQDEQAIDVLLSSEVGCEGLDFQFCDFLVNYDLPWNPMRVEQRIGRIDRYGQQSETVGIVNFITPGTVDAEIYERCLWRIGVFQHAVGGSEEILGSITQELHDIAESFTLTEDERDRRLQQLADNGIRQIREEQELESRQSELFGLTVPNQSWRDELEAAESFWLSPGALQTAVGMYLSTRLGSGGEYLLGEKATQTLRLSLEARNRLLQDYQKLPRSVEPLWREWEKWLKGSQPMMQVTFDQATAHENPRVTHLTMLHPLVRQAAHHLNLPGPVYCSLAVSAPDVPAGCYRFALYRWRKDGARPDESLVGIAESEALEPRLLDLLRAATDSGDSLPGDAADWDGLEVRHHARWSEARANHFADNRQLVEHRIQSYTVSHRARCNVIQDQIDRATNEKIRVMKQSELARANVEFDRRLAEIQHAEEAADIRSAAIVFGSLTIV
jgi:superfamily II DNA or RNA helicase